ncbi:TonB-dependent receptor [Niabella drilacis]|uniref:Outer membrane receptor proteins, mostly Fe transport n=1 Tax=Niabella drilacis (strain DSM 25811 / CCM 8410 / CCUG 62505 / LMG 26954 / E90) TaxID=1285928 RepID=A0A1G6TWG8_NIADE|nr:TonB-dependent receptor [Niabella drilacis]SDD33450.1 Outer membrane receptor proteins, mostly Fe transport [Niabella drilacis]
MKPQTALFTLLITVAALNTLICPAQTPRISLYGYVEDSVTGERLIGATLSATTDQSKPVATTNAFGYFSLTAPHGSSLVLTCSYAGYESKTITIDPAGLKTVIVKLVPEVVQEDEVIVTSNENRIATNNIGQLKLSGSLVKKMPKFLGDNDPLKVMQTLPGITQGMEGTTGLIVRGGSPDQTLFLLDGIPVYNPTHLGGIFSPFNGDAIKDVSIYKGNFPARFGERLSSVVDLATKDGNMKKLAGEGSVGMLASKVLFEGPVQKDKSSFLISARRTYWDLLAAPIIGLTNTAEEKRKMGLYFYDINAKLNYILSPKDRLYASFFTSNDNYRFKTTTDLKNYDHFDENIARMGWQNISGSLRWNHVFSPRIFANTTVYATDYKIRTDYYNNALDKNVRTIEDGQYRSQVSDAGVKTDLEYRRSSLHALRFGAAASYKQFRPGSSSRKTTTDGTVTQTRATANGRQSSPELAVYAEDHLSISEQLNANAGLRASTFKAGATWYKSLEPRVSLNYTPIRNLRISAAYSQMNQYIHLLANNSVSLPTDIWVPATPQIQPLFSRQYSLGVNTSLTDNDVDLGVEAYYKTFKGVTEYLDGESYLSSSVKNWEQVVETGNGKAYGIELFLQKKFGRATGWASYTYSRSLRRFPTINNGKEFPFKYDRPHAFNLVFMYHFNQHWRFSANWVFQSGAPFTLPTSTYKVINPESYSPYISGEYISGRNAFRLLDYHRLDMGFTWSKKKRSFEKYWDFSFYNLYNRKNPVIYSFDQDFMRNAKVLKGTGIFPFMPSISYGFKF